MTSGDLTPVNPETGEYLDRIDTTPPEALADALDALRARIGEYKDMAGQLETELRRRLAIKGRKQAVFGAWEVEAKVPRESVWDPIELEAALRQLVDDGTIQAGEVVDVITRPPVVSRSKAKALAASLDGDSAYKVNAACSWRDKPGQLVLTRSVDLIAATPDGDDVPPKDAAAVIPTSPTQLTIQELFADE